MQPKKRGLKLMLQAPLSSEGYSSCTLIQRQAARAKGPGGSVKRSEYENLYQEQLCIQLTYHPIRVKANRDSIEWREQATQADMDRI